MIALIAAIDSHNCIGKNGEIPWHISNDMKRVKALTIGKNVIMGRNTWESIPKKFQPLPHRVNIVITSQTDYVVPFGVELYTSIQQAINAHAQEDSIGFGGEQIYNEMITYADTLYITHVLQTVDSCTAFFPKIDMDVWHEISRENFDGYSFVTYQK